MAELAKIEDQWRYWTSALNGEFIEDLIQRGNPASGFYRDRSTRAIAIWRDEAGNLLCSVTSGYAPRHADEIDELFGFVCRAPITRDLFMHVKNGGAWPEAVEPASEPPQAEDLPSHEASAAEIESLKARFNTWLATLVNGISTEAEDAKVSAYAEAVMKIKKRAEDTHKSEKAPWLEGGRKVDAAWKPVIASADDAKKSILGTARDYRIKRDNAERMAREAEAQRIREQQERERAAGEIVTPVQVAPRKPTGLRTVRQVEITDVKSLALQIASMNNPAPEFMRALETVARRLLEGGTKVDGARIVEKKVAA